VSVPTIGYAIAIYYIVANAEASANLSRFDGIRYGHRSERARTLERGLLRSRGEGFGAEVKRRIMLGTFALSSGYYDAYYGRAQRVRAKLRHEFDGRLRKNFDYLITPTTPEPAFAIGAKTDDPLSMYLSDIFTAPANLVGIPAIAVPSGFGGTRRFVACSNAYASSISFGSLHAMPVKLTPNGAGFALKPAGKRRRRRVRHHAERHDDRRIAGARGDAAPRRRGRGARRALRLHHLVDAVRRREPDVLRAIGLVARAVGARDPSRRRCRAATGRT
jgi:hypothetical protein